MSSYLFLLPLSLMLGVIGLLTFLWTVKNSQYNDMDGSRYRILDNDDFPLAPDESGKPAKPEQLEMQENPETQITRDTSVCSNKVTD